MGYQFGMKNLRMLAALVTGLPRRACARATATNNTGKTKLVKKIITTGQTWVAPVSTAWVNDLVGQGGLGTPEGSETLYWYDTYKDVTTTYDSPEWGTDSSTGQVYQGNTGISSPDEVPSGYCNDVYTSFNHKTVSTCYYYYLGSEESVIPATTGGTATAFGEYFIGGDGGPATPIAVGYKTVTPGASYVIYLPDDSSSVSFSYYE